MNVNNQLTNVPLLNHMMTTTAVMSYKQKKNYMDYMERAYKPKIIISDNAADLFANVFLIHTSSR